MSNLPSHSLAFQSTLLQEERRTVYPINLVETDISIHAPTRGATKTAQQDNDILPDFNPRSYKRSDTQAQEAMCEIYISIHAPTRGATLETWMTMILLPISIHAPTRGATICTCPCGTAFYNFNPRSYKRSDSDR